MRSLVTTTMLLLTCVVDATAGLEWPTYAGGPRRLFFNPAETQVTPANVASLRVKWKAAAGAAITVAPSVTTLDLPGEGPTQVVFFSSWDHTLYAVRLRDGSEVWRFAVPDYPGGNYPDVAAIDVTMVDGVPHAHFASEQYLYSLDARTGAEIWRFAAGTGCLIPPGLCGFAGERNEIESSPLVAGDVVIFGMDTNDRVGGKGGLYGIDVRDGRLRWFFDLESGKTCRPEPGDDIRRYDGYHGEAELGLPAGFLATRPGCDHPRTPNGCSLLWSSVAYDAARARVFTASGNCDTDVDPRTLKPPPPMPPYDEAIFALGLDGTPVWRWRPREVDTRDLDFGGVPNLFTIEIGGMPHDVVGVGGKDGVYYVIDRDGKNAVNGVAWDDADPSLLPYWRTQVVQGGPLGGIISSAAVDEASRRVYFSTAPGDSVFDPERPTVHALDLDSGAIAWQNTAEADADASFAPTMAIPGVVFVGGAATGALRSYDAATGAKLGSIGVTFVLAAAPTVVDGYVLVGGGVGEQSGNPADASDAVSRLPQDLTALCVPGTPACDEDRDGVDYPEDCDDRDARRHPGAREVGGNAVDEDCDGTMAGAADLCLQNGSAPQDRRDLDTLATTLEAACPCATSGSAKRYRRCARPLVRGALVTGALRRACKPLVEQATCGRRRSVVCCERRTTDDRRTCRVRAPRKCTSSGHVTRTIEPATHCAATDCLLDVPSTTSTLVTTSTTTPETTTTSSTLPPSWSAIQAAVIGPRCGSCHAGGGTGGLDGLDGCATAYAALVGVPSIQLTSMALVEPGDPDRSWLMQKVDATQGAFDAQCTDGSCGAMMPPGPIPLAPDARAVIRTWIRNGAIDDCSP